MENYLSPQDKKKYLLQKYTKRDYNLTELNPKFAVYFNPSIEKIKDWSMVCVCDTKDEAIKEILWRKNYMTYGDGDLVIDNDKNFSTWRDETKNVNQQGVTYEPGQELMNIDYSSKGNMLQVIANSSTPEQQKNGFKGIAHYAGIEIGNYQGFYKIEEIYEIS